MPLVSSRGFNMNPDITGAVQRSFAFGDKYRRQNLADERQTQIDQVAADRNRMIQESMGGAFGQEQPPAYGTGGGAPPAWGGGQQVQQPTRQQGIMGQTQQPGQQPAQEDPNQGMNQYRGMIQQQAQQQGETVDLALRNLFRIDPAIGKKALEGIDQLDKRANRKAADWAFNAEQLAPREQEEAILRRADEIVARGGNPNNTLGLMNLTPENRQFALKNMQVAALTNEERIARSDVQTKAAVERTGKETVATEKAEIKRVEDDLKASDTKFDRAKKIRGEIDKVSADYRKIEGAYGRIEAVTEEVSAAGDLALIFNFMKLLDPGSVVRESEFATAANTAGVPDRIRNTYNRVISGERLGKDQRKDFLKQAQKIFTRSKTDNNKKIRKYVSIGKRFGVAEADLLGAEVEAQTQQEVAGVAEEVAVGAEAAALSAEEQAELDALRAQFGGR